MPKTVQVRDLDDDVYAALRRHAASAGMSVPELLRREIAKIASRPSLEDWLARTARRQSTARTDEVVAALDELRGPWPSDRR